MSVKFAMLSSGNCGVRGNFTARALRKRRISGEHGEIMISRRFKRVAGIVGASALLVAGATTAQAIGPGDINPDVSDGYYGWHQGDTNGHNSFEVPWDGLYFGYNGKAQIIKGLVGTGERPDQQLSADQLIDQIANSGLADQIGRAHV